MDKNTDTEATYIYKGKEVQMTGRSATKPLRGGKEEVLFEVKPSEFADTTSTKYNSWVKMSELYKVG